MDNKILILKLLLIAYRENLLPQDKRANKELILSSLDSIQLPEVNMGRNDERTVIEGIKNIIIDIINNTSSKSFTKDDILTDIRILTADYDPDYLDVIEEALSQDYDEKELLKVILRDVRVIERHYKELKLVDIISKASYDIRFKRNTIKDINAFATELGSELDSFQTSSLLEDPAEIGSVDSTDPSSFIKVLNDAKDIEKGTAILKTGWQGVNTMMSGGLRRGEFIMMPALQHKNKSGMTRDIFRQIAMYNDPNLFDVTKIPTLVLIIFEDQLHSTINSLYISIKYQETKKFVDTSKISSKKMTEYMLDVLTKRGWHIVIKKINPSEWSYRNVIGTLLQFQAEGHEVVFCGLDYLGMLPTTGCGNGGPMGSAHQDMVRRIKNFGSANNITILSPWQLNSTAKKMLTEGVSDKGFLKEVVGRGFTKDCQTLDQETDMDIYIHLFPHTDGTTYQHLMRGKHRGVLTIPEKYKSLYLPFSPKGMPILDDINEDEPMHLYRLPLATIEDSSLDF